MSIANRRKRGGGGGRKKGRKNVGTELSKSWIPKGFCVEEGFVTKDHLKIAEDILRERKIPVPSWNPNDGGASSSLRKRKEDLCELLINSNISLIPNTLVTSSSSSSCVTPVAIHGEKEGIPKRLAADIPPERLIRLRSGSRGPIECWDIMDLLEYLNFYPRFGARFTPYQRDRIARQLGQLEVVPADASCQTFGEQETLCKRAGSRCKYNRRQGTGGYLKLLFAPGVETKLDEGECYVDPEFVRHLLTQCPTVPLNEIQMTCYDVVVPILRGRTRRQEIEANTPASLLATNPHLSILQDFLLEARTETILNNVKEQIYAIQDRGDLCEATKNAFANYVLTHEVGETKQNLDRIRSGFWSLGLALANLQFVYIELKHVREVWKLVRQTLLPSSVNWPLIPDTNMIQIIWVVVNIVLLFTLGGSLLIRGVKTFSKFRLVARGGYVVWQQFRLRGFQALGLLFFGKEFFFLIIPLILAGFFKGSFIKQYCDDLIKGWNIKLKPIETAFLNAVEGKPLAPDVFVDRTIAQTITQLPETMKLTLRSVNALLSASALGFAERRSRVPSQVIESDPNSPPTSADSEFESQSELVEKPSTEPYIPPYQRWVLKAPS